MQGRLSLRIEPDHPARYGLRIDGEVLNLNALLGSGLRLAAGHRILCVECDSETPKTYGRGYCYDCFAGLARNDLCMMAPARCHHHLGTCREPEWGEGFCMQPHVVYLANTTGLKVGITRAERTLGRWHDQGAVQGLVVCRTETRKRAGEIEAQFAQHTSDRADWRKLITRDPPIIDLQAHAVRLRQLVDDPSIDWQVASEVRLSYPVARYGRPERLQLQTGPVESRLVGCKGSYLLFEHGALNVAELAGFEVTVELMDNPPPAPTDAQLELF